MGRRENSRRYRGSTKGKLAAKQRRGTVPDIRARLNYENKRLDRVTAEKSIISALLAGTYDVEEMYYAVRDQFPDHTDSQIFKIMKTYRSKRPDQPSIDQFQDRRGIVIPVTGTFPEYYEEGYES